MDLYNLIYKSHDIITGTEKKYNNPVMLWDGQPRSTVMLSIALGVWENILPFDILFLNVASYNHATQRRVSKFERVFGIKVEFSSYIDREKYDAAMMAADHGPNMHCRMYPMIDWHTDELNFYLKEHKMEIGNKKLKEAL